MLRANGTQLANNRKALFNYSVEEQFEAGIVLLGSEVKSLRYGKVSLGEAHAAEKNGEIYLLNCTISEYPGATVFNHEPKRPRKLLLKKRERNKMISGIQKKGMTLIPLSMYFTKKGLVKLQLALAKGKKDIDKRQTIKERDWNREKQRVLKNQSHE